LYWAEALAEQSEDQALKTRFTALAKQLADNEQKIVGELNAAQGVPVDIGGYFDADPEKTNAVMRPSATLNALIAEARV
jgi:isocitrate dehydrogenase